MPTRNQPHETAVPSNPLRVRWVHRRRPVAINAAVITVVIFAACVIGILSRLPGTLAVFWLANALLLGVLLRNPWLATLPTWVGAAGGYLAADLVMGSDVRTALLLNSANLVGVLVGFYGFHRIGPADLSFQRVQSASWLAALTGTAAISGAVVGAFAQVMLYEGAWWSAFLSWSAVECINYTVILPIVLTFPVGRLRTDAGGSRSDRTRRLARRLAVPLALFAVALPLSWAMGGIGSLVYTTPALIAVALLGDVFLTSLFVAAATVWALTLTVHFGFGPSAAPGFPVIPSTIIGLSLLAFCPLTIACAMRERERVYQALRETMTQDDLTPTYRRSEFVRRAEPSLATAAAAGQPSALLMMDLDHFKQLNDSLGHAKGDQALVGFTEIVRGCVGSGALFARWGGEEFALLLSDPNLEFATATATAEEIRARQHERAQAKFGAQACTVSIGLAYARASEVDLVELLAVGDRALYRAKATGRNAVVSEVIDRAGSPEDPRDDPDASVLPA